MRGKECTGNDGRVGFEGRMLAEFDATFPFLVFAADYGIGRFFRFDASLIEGAVAETMARTYEHWERVRRDGNPIAWVARCSMEVCLEHIRAAATPMSTAISHSLDLLPKQQRDVAVLRYLIECDEPTTAAALGVSVAEARAAALDARGQLGVLLSGVYRETDGGEP
jgi:DNA-directed RNA polymerase specialized sigma24 family protein